MHKRTTYKFSGILALALVAGACSQDEPTPESSETIENAEAGTTAPAVDAAAPTEIENGGETAAAPLKDPIRSPGGMESKCLAKVNEMTGGGVIGTRMIEEAESGVMIYVNVEGAEAPWQCFGSRDGTLGEVYYGGSEGAL